MVLRHGSLLNKTVLRYRCACARGYRGTNGGKGCVLRVLGDTCAAAGDCDVAVTYSTCTHGQCRCRPSFKPQRTHGVSEICVARKRVYSAL